MCMVREVADALGVVQEIAAKPKIAALAGVWILPDDRLAEEEVGPGSGRRRGRRIVEFGLARDERSGVSRVIQRVAVRGDIEQPVGDAYHSVGAAERAPGDAEPRCDVVIRAVLN